MIEAVIFDFDGVLVESVDVKTRAFAKLFEGYGPDVVRKVVDFHLSNGGMTRYDKFGYYYGEILQEPLSEAKLQELADQFSQLVVEQVIAAPYVAGAREFLDRYSGTLDLFVVSATPEEEIRHIVRSRDMQSYFKGVYGAPQTKLALTQRILEENGYWPSSVLFVGDATSDYEAACDAGCAFVARVGGEQNTLFPDGVLVMQDLTGLGEMVADLGQGSNGSLEKGTTL
jgi:phosphoglycolate phosphatase-like HAD superfamily hydrolase